MRSTTPIVVFRNYTKLLHDSFKFTSTIINDLEKQQVCVSKIL